MTTHMSGFRPVVAKCAKFPPFEVGAARALVGVDRVPSGVHLAPMNDLRETEVLEIGREAAVRLLGDGKVEHIEVSAHPETTNEPAYHFIIVADQSADQRKPLVRSYIGMAIRDTLLAHGDETYPYVRIIDPRDWHRVKSAGPS